MAIDTKRLAITYSDEAIQATQFWRISIGNMQDSLASPTTSRMRFAEWYPTKLRPFPHQMQAIEALRDAKWRCLLADDMGLGKSATALWAAHDAGAQRLLIVCPVSVKFNWAKELKQTLNEEATIIHGERRMRADQITDLGDGHCYCTIINYDLLRHLTEDQFNTLRTFSADAFVILDESHYVKSRKTLRTQLCFELTQNAKHVLCLTGTPVRNMVDDLFSQVEMVRPSTWKSYADFEARYLDVQLVDFGGAGRKKPIIRGSKNHEALAAVMNTLQIRRKKDEVMDLPPKVHTYPELQLDTVTKPIYDAMKDYARLELEQLDHDLTVFAPQARSGLEAFMRCEQIAQGFVGGVPDIVMERISESVAKHAVRVEGRPNELIFPEATKLRWLLEKVEDVLAQGGSPVVFTRFNGPMWWLRDALLAKSIKTAFLHGSMNAEQKHEVVESFQDSTVDVLLVQVKMAEGFNLVRSQDVLFYGRDWSPAINSQAEDRCHRIGQKGTVNVQVPIVRDTVEVSIARRLCRKASSAEEALQPMTISEMMEAL
jgi:SWI/SNF-related matrix-associated actin-dependent regulator 1 of chromatin subfamily A